MAGSEGRDRRISEDGCSAEEPAKRRAGAWGFGASAAVAMMAVAVVSMHAPLDAPGALPKPQQLDTERLLLSSVRSIDTRGEPGFFGESRWWDVRRWGCEAHQGGRRQFYVQTVPQLTIQQRRELEFDAGARLGSYHPHNAFLLVGDCASALAFSRARHVVWVGERPPAHKMLPALASFNGSGFGASQVDIFVALVPEALRAGESAAAVALAFKTGLREAGVVVELRVASDRKLTMQVAANDAGRAVGWVAEQAAAVWLEEKVLFASRNFASNKIVVSGLSEEVRAMETIPLKEADVGLDGAGVVIAISDTGLDFDHCMLWQESFQFPCFDPYDTTTAGRLHCPASSYAGLLANQDFEHFIEKKMTHSDPLDSPLLESGRSVGASVTMAPLDAYFPDRADRLTFGMQFSVRNDSSITLLLDAWRDVRPHLLALQVKEGNKLCETCGGTIKSENGSEYFTATSAWAYTKADQTSKAINTTKPKEWRRLQNLMFEKCFCFFTVPSTATVSQIEKWQGPVPPIRDFLSLVLTPTAAFSRKGAGLGAIDEKLMATMCNITRGGGVWPKPRSLRDSDGVLIDICQAVEFEWGLDTLVFETCKLEWEARLIEDSIAKCFAAEYLPPPVDNEFLKQYIPTLTAEARLARLVAFPAEVLGLNILPKIAALEFTNPLSIPGEYAALAPVASRMYTYNTTLAWWKEYTRVPPFDFHDTSRRVVNSYFVMQGCEPCGMCARLRLDSRDYPGISSNALMPVDLVARQELVIHLQPTEGDWRLDAFEARNVDFSLQVEVEAILSATTGLSAPPLAVCIMSEDDFLSTTTEQRMSRDFQINVKDYCLNDFALPDQPLNYSFSRVNPAPTVPAGAPLSSTPPPFNDAPQYLLKDRAPKVPRSADGWRVIVWNNGTEPITVNAMLQLHTLDVDCSDKLDGELIPTDDTHSAPLGGASHVSSDLLDDQCEVLGKTYCDNTYTSGRQLDLCFHCGGACLPPYCNKDLCIDTNPMLARIRYNAQFPSGFVTKLFTWVGLGAPNSACPSPTGTEVGCAGYLCNFLNMCKGRLETYRVDTHQLRLTAGTAHTFAPGTLSFDSLDKGRLMRVRVTLLSDPNELLHGKLRKAGRSDEGGGTVEVSPRIAAAIQASEENTPITYFQADGSFMFEYEGHNVTFIEYTDTRFEFLANGTFVDSLLAGLIVTPDMTLGTSVQSRSLLLRFELQLLRPDGTAYSPDSYYVEGATVERAIDPCQPFETSCGCIAGLTGPACDMFALPMDIALVIDPLVPGKRVVKPAKSAAGRRASLSRGGHGTHIASSTVGRAFEMGGASAAPPAGVYDGIASGSQLAFFDMGESSSVYLTPPESLYADLLARVYDKAGARVLLNPWTCEDTMWWQKQDRAFDAGAAVAKDRKMNIDPSICNRYTTSSWEVDDFVAQHQDMLVVFPAGDNGDGFTTVSAPGTCKNCITVGTTQGWPDDLAAATKHLRRQCLPADCPVYVDKTDTCAAVNFTSPHALPACCAEKYSWDGQYYAPDTLHATSARGYGVSSQAPSDDRGRSAYPQSPALAFQRFKPEVVAPGVNVVAGRSDGDTSINSHGTRGCRCCTEAGGALDHSCLAALSGSSVASAKVAALAAVVRQYFEGGFYPAGVSEFSPIHAPSAALVKAVLIASGDPMASISLVGGGGLDISSLTTPNRFVGFGQVHILNILKVKRAPGFGEIEIAPAKTDCSCTGNNTFLVNSPARRARFGEHFGTSCKPWMAGTNASTFPAQKCDRMFAATPRARPAPAGSFFVRDFDATCCQSFCLVDASCPSAQKWAEFPDLHYSFDICQDDRKTLETCEWRDLKQTRDIRTVAFDHIITDYGNTTDENTGEILPDGAPTAFENSVDAKKLSIAPGESFSYLLRIERATLVQPLVVTLVYTDPAGAPGASEVLVNDLDLSVQLTELEASPGGNTTIASLQPKDNTSLLVWGNGVQGGDRYNNAERVIVTDAKASIISVSVIARKVVVGMAGSPCQTFALVISGALDLQVFGVNPPVLTVSPEAQPGICGRPGVVPPLPPPGLSTLDITLIAVGSGVGGLLLCCLTYWLASRRAVRLNKKLENSSHANNIGYLSTVEKVEREEGIAVEGAPDFIIFGAEASTEDGFYVGLPIMLLEGEGEGETSTITEYDSRTKKAMCEWELGGPREGTRYVIAHDNGIGLGYKIGDAGYIPISALPHPEKEGMNDVFKKQHHALQRARENYGGLSDKDLDMLNIGRFKRTWTKTEEMQALHAGVTINAPVYSKDLFLYSIKQASTDAEFKIVTEKEKAKHAYVAGRSNALADQFAAPPPPGALRGKNVHDLEAAGHAPPLRSQNTREGVSRVLGVQGIKRKPPGARHISGGFGADSFSAQTWEPAGLVLESSPEKTEPLSGTVDPTMVTATLLTKGNGSGYPLVPHSPASRPVSGNSFMGNGNGSGNGNGNGHQGNGHVTFQADDSAGRDSGRDSAAARAPKPLALKPADSTKSTKGKKGAKGALDKEGMIAEEKRQMAEKAKLIAKAFGD